MHVDQAEPDADKPDELGGLQRIGETTEFGWLLLRLLNLSGFQVHVTTPVAPAPGRRILVTITGGTLEQPLRREADQVADIASSLFLEAMAHRLPADLLLEHQRAAA